MKSNQRSVSNLKIVKGRPALVSGSPDQNTSAPNDAQPASNELTSQVFREAMSCVPAAVHVVTTDGVAGRCGATVSAFCSVSDDPPSVLICLNRSTRMHSTVLQNRVFCVNTLCDGHENVSDVFAGRGDMAMEDRFSQLAWTPLATTCPALDEASLNIDCEIFSLTEMGTHSVIIGKVLDIRMREPGDSLLYFKRGYTSVST
ncbi:flavin reductase [Roseibium sp. TrichSKD4]|uniref:flavin reductase n=1 Tax=Roseibium sp. TrichSKD4 TaxID=744980 RepID=UPI000308B7E4|nr:flavin reductase [Roseibium sp. TrichSKD4]